MFQVQHQWSLTGLDLVSRLNIMEMVPSSLLIKTFSIFIKEWWVYSVTSLFRAITFALYLIFRSLMGRASHRQSKVRDNHIWQLSIDQRQPEKLFSFSKWHIKEDKNIASIGNNMQLSWRTSRDYKALICCLGVNVSICLY